MLGSLHFNGDDNYVAIADDPLNEIGDGDFTFEAWIKGDAAGQSGHPMIFSNRGDNSFGGGIMLFLHSQWGGSQYKMLCLQVGASNYFVLNNGTFNGSLLDNRCHHVAITRSANTLSYYIDGALIGIKNTSNLGSIALEQPLLIGKDQATNNTFNGTISQCRIWNVARTESEINDHKDLSLQGDEPGLLAYWEMDDEDSQVLTDKTGEYHGFLGSSIVADAQDPSWSDDGCVEASVVSTNEQDQVFSFTLSPNPTPGLLTIQHQIKEEVTFRLISTNGQLLLTKTLNQSTSEVDLSAFPKGVYMLQLSYADHIITQKVIKS
ncbi:MAG: LamG-like jellyroll fold domain-containing protein [Bacteroidota bacterium]